MKQTLHEDEALYLQIAKTIEEEILRGGIVEENQIPSTNELSKLYQINPATVLKGITLLVDQDILYKKRGIGMFVQQGAKEKIQNARKGTFKDIILKQFLKEASLLGISYQELMAMIGEASEGERSEASGNRY